MYIFSVYLIDLALDLSSNAFGVAPFSNSSIILSQLVLSAVEYEILERSPRLVMCIQCLGLLEVTSSWEI